MDGLMLSYIVRELTEKLTGSRVDRVLQPEKDELHLLLRGQSGTYRLLLCASANNARVHLTNAAKPNPTEPPMFCMLLRKQLQGGRVQAVSQVAGDRVVEIAFQCADEMGERVRRDLVCEIMGRHSNLILRDAQGRILDAIHHVGANISRVREVKPGLLYTPPPAQAKLDPARATAGQLQAALESGAAKLDKALAEILMGFGRESSREVAYRLTGQEGARLDPAGRAALAGPLHALLSELPAFGPGVLLMDENGEAADVFPFAQQRFDPARQRPFPEGPSAAMDAFYTLRDKRERLAQKTAALARSIRANIERCENRLAIHEEALAADSRMEEARVCGELLTANLHLLGKARGQAEVTDYYTGKARVIALDPRLSPAQNAQRFFWQYRKLRAAQIYAKEQVHKIRGEIEMLASQLDDLRKCEEPLALDEIRAELVRSGHLRAAHTRGKARKMPPSEPMRVISSDGILIRVGRNSVQNDRLTLSAHGDALWLHAKDMAGSHVVVDHTGEVPEKTLWEAAHLAAWFSRGVGSGQVPVDYTRRRHVRKPSGAAAGFVVYTNQKTLYVTPDEALIKGLTRGEQ
ncbi:MAG: NFACT family protein [Firmicutes bacterium]|nr:NFACT family protein [Bacillota bacterium]